MDPVARIVIATDVLVNPAGIVTVSALEFEALPEMVVAPDTFAAVDGGIAFEERVVNPWEDPTVPQPLNPKTSPMNRMPAHRIFNDPFRLLLNTRSFDRLHVIP